MYTDIGWHFYIWTKKLKLEEEKEKMLKNWTIISLNSNCLDHMIGLRDYSTRQMSLNILLHFQKFFLNVLNLHSFILLGFCYLIQVLLKSKEQIT